MSNKKATLKARIATVICCIAIAMMVIGTEVAEFGYLNYPVLIAAIGTTLLTDTIIVYVIFTPNTNSG